MTPDRLYRGKFIEAFIRTCKENGLPGAILSDVYGVWFPHERHEWYEKHPRLVTEREFQELVRDVNEKLDSYDEIHFYRNPGRFHPLYGRLLRETRLRDRITMISSVKQIR